MNRIIETAIYHHFTTHECRPIRKTSPYFSDFSGTEKKEWRVPNNLKSCKVLLYYINCKLPRRFVENIM